MDAPSPEERAQLGAAGVAAGLGCSIVVSVILFIGGGVAIDQATDQTPIFTLVGVVLALTVAGYQLYELATVGRVDRRPGPMARQIGRLHRPGAAGRRATGTSDASVGREGEGE